MARYNPITRSINLNSMINWDDPDFQPAIVDGVGNLIDGPFVQLLQGEAALLGVDSVTAAQFMDISIFHELSHFNGAIGNPDNPAVERALWTDCIK